MGKPHKNAEFIKAWADGAEIQVYDESDDKWYDVTHPSWCSSNEYRIKPDKKTAGEVCRLAFNHYLEDDFSDNASCWDFAAQAVIEAYKRGEFDE